MTFKSFGWLPFEEGVGYASNGDNMRFLRSTINSSKDNNKQYESSIFFLPEYLKLKKIHIFHYILYEII